MDIKYKFLLVMICCMGGLSTIANAQQVQQKKILVIGLDTLQFSSNVFFIDELAYYNSVDVYKVVDLYNRQLMRSLREFYTDEYNFVIADSADVAAVHTVSVFVELKNDYGEEFIGIAPAEGHGQVLFDLMEKYNADYVLIINAYQIYHKDPPEYVSYDIRAEHIIHYDIFNKELSNIYGGQATLTSTAVEAIYMGGHYRDFTRGIITLIAAHEKSLENDKPLLENVDLLRYEKYVNASTLGLSVSFDGPYGLFGVYYSRLFGRDLEGNIGLGYDFSGLKIGLGANYYFNNVFKSKLLKPFAGLNYSFASGNSFELGGQKDDYGNQLNPDDVSRYKIYSDHTIHLQGGLSYWRESTLISISLGYSYPFLGRSPELLAGKESEGRMNFVQAMNPGGLGVMFKYSIFINERFLSNFW